jgi:Tol biopolymer transport system component
MVSGTVWPYGDPFLERQDEPSLAVSTRNALHLLAGANDYRSVDLNLPETEPGERTGISAPAGTGEPWVGQYMSVDGGARWQSTLLPGFPQDTSAQGLASPAHGFTTAADPVIAAGTNGLFYYGGIAFNRGESRGLIFVSRFMDLNNREGNPDIVKDTFPIRYIDTIPVAFGTNNIPSHFLDKPALAVDIPRGNNTCNFVVPQGSGLPDISQSNIPAGNVYVAYADVSSSGGNQISTIYLSRSTNCGATWSTPVALSRGYQLSQGATIQIDPETGIVYVAWRVIHSAQQPKDGIAIAASLDGGRNFLPAITLVSLPPFNPASPAPSLFDQNTSFFSFRTTAYPVMAVGDSGIPLIPGPLYLAWSQRIPSSVNPTILDTKIMMLAIPGNASFTSSGFRPPTPFPLDNGQITNDEGGVFNLTTGFQLMPAMTFNQGKLMVLYYDLRQDHSIGQFTPSVMNDKFVPDADGNFFEEDRYTVAENPDPTAYSPYFISDAGLTVRRHTIDVVLAQANASLSVPNFTYARVSRYDMGLFAGENSGESAPFHQLKFDPPNLPMFIKGNGAFMGDYLAVAGQPFALVKCGSSQCWTYNNPSPPWIAGTFLAAPKPAPASAVHYASWTSNQDVIPPLNGDWATYKPITGNPPAQSVYNGGPTEGCQPNTGFEGDRNQNVYSSRITQGLAISSPQSSKPLSRTVERGFVILVQNHTNGRSTANGLINYFRLTIANQLVNGFASFAQFVPPGTLAQSVPPFPGFNRLTSIDVGIAPHTGVARTLFAASSNPLASILVNVIEIDGLGPTAKTVPGGLSGFILLNADGTVPPSLVDPDGNTGADGISGVELYNPNVSAPNVSAPNVSAPNVSAPNVSAPNVSAPNVSAPNVSAPNVSAPNVSAYSAANPNVSAPNVSAPNVSAASPSDGTYTITNEGNTTASYKVALVGSTSTPLQLLASQIYMTPQTDGKCNLVTQQQNITLANVPNAPIVSPDQLGNPNVSAAPPTETTIAIGPHDTVYLSVRADVTPQELSQILSQNVALELQPHAIASNDTQTTTPPVVGQLFITTTSLPNAVVGQTYNQRVSAIGGVTTGGQCFGYFWTWIGAFEGPKPPGLNISSSGVISGTPTQSGTYNVIVRVGDCGDHTATRQFTLTVIGVPDLIVESLTHAPAQPTTVDLMTVTAVIRNIGNGTAGPSNLRLQIGGETSPPPIAVPSLAPGAAFTATRQIFLDVAQAYINTATADSTNVVAESNEQNNTLTDQFVVTAPFGNLTFVTPPNVSSIVSGPITPPVQVRALDNQGAAIPGYTITLSLGNTGTGPGGGTLSGTFSQLTDQTGTATFPNLAIDQPGTGYTLVAQAQGATSRSSSSFNVAPITPVFVGQATDAAGDALGGGTNPDLVSATITVFNNDTVKLSVRFNPGTFDPATTSAEFTLDTDQNVHTGLPGIDGGCSAPDSNLIGTDYIVDLSSGFGNNQGSILASGSDDCPPQFALVGNAPVTIQSDGMDITVPLSMLTGATAGAAPRRPWNFKVTTSTFLGNGFTALLDRMPDTGSNPASTAAAGGPTNGRIAFGTSALTIVNVDGSAPFLMPGGGVFPDWSPDGKKLVFLRTPNGGAEQIFVGNADGSGVQQLTTAGSNTWPKWSPDGTKIVFARQYTKDPATGFTAQDIFTINADGSGVVVLTDSGSLVPGFPFDSIISVDTPNWSPDGTKIVFTAFLNTPLGETCNLWTLRIADGNWVQLTPTDFNTIRFGSCFLDSNPDWSPDGAKVVFHREAADPVEGLGNRIYTINADGSGMSQLTSAADNDFYASWSPDGTKIVFLRIPRISETPVQFGNPDLYFMNPNGAGLTQITNDPVYEGLASWQPF